MPLDTLEVITLFVGDITETKSFYRRVFAAEVIYEDEVSSLLRFSNLMINLLDAREAGELVEPAPVAQLASGAQCLLTIRVEDCAAVCTRLQGQGVVLLNGPVYRPWGRRTAAFADPSGHVWEIAQVL